MKHTADKIIPVGLIGFGMIVEETYLPFFEAVRSLPIYTPETGAVAVQLQAVATRTGRRVAAYLSRPDCRLPALENISGDDALSRSNEYPIKAVCIATPDDRHYAPAMAAISAGKHVLLEKPSVLDLESLDQLLKAAQKAGVLVKVVYHKLADPDHKKLRTLVQDGVLQHVNNGYCSLLEPKSISSGQFAEWIDGRNPATYVAVHYYKLIDYTFGPLWKLSRISATGQRGLISSPVGPTWDSVQVQIVYTHPDGREAAFDIHTSWVTPDNFPGYVEQEVQFRFDNAVWSAHQRKRGVELTVENKTPLAMKNTPNYHYNGSFLEPWGKRTQRGYGIEVIERFFHEVAFVEYGGDPDTRMDRLNEMRALSYNDLAADRTPVAIVQAVEAILNRAADGRPGSQVIVNGTMGGLVLYELGSALPHVLYHNPV